MSKESKDVLDMTIAQYYPKDDTSNFEKLRDNWNNALRAKYGPITSFLTTEEYPKAKEPDEPDFKGVTEGSIKYKAMEKAYLEGVSECVKENRRMEQEKPKIAATILAHISPECLAHCARAEEWKDLYEKCDDPLAIWISMSKSMRSRTMGDTLRIRKGACQAYNRHYQKEGQTLAAYTKEREHLISSMKALGCAEKPEDELVMDYIDGLDRKRYSTLQIHVQNERERMPKTMVAAYEKAAGWVVSVTKRAESYVSEQINTKKKEVTRASQTSRS
jgi:hypothetical protein